MEKYIHSLLMNRWTGFVWGITCGGGITAYLIRGTFVTLLFSLGAAFACWFFQPTLDETDRN